MQFPFSGFTFGVVVFPTTTLATTLATTTTTGGALFLTHDCAGKRLVLGGDFPKELFGALHGSLLSKVRGWTVQRTSLHLFRIYLIVN